MSDETTAAPPPLPHAAPAPAAEAGTGGLEGPLIDKARRLWACNVADIDPARVAALEAERDRLALEVAALRGAMPPTLTLAMIASRIEHQCADDDDAAVLRRMLAALATATATPPAAEAGRKGIQAEIAARMWAEEAAVDAHIRALVAASSALSAAAGTGGWTREAPTEAGWRWVKIYGHDRPDAAYVRYFCGDWCAKIGDTEYGPVVIQLYGPPLVVPSGWVAALDTPQEADHAR